MSEGKSSAVLAAEGAKQGRDLGCEADRRSRMLRARVARRGHLQAQGQAKAIEDVRRVKASRPTRSAGLPTQTLLRLARGTPTRYEWCPATSTPHCEVPGQAG